MAEEEYTTIQVRRAAREELAKIASYEESMADVVDRLLESYKRHEAKKRKDA